MLTTLLPFAKTLVEFATKLAGIRASRRKRLAKYCEAIATAITSAHTALQAGTAPYEACARMQGYSEELPHVAAGMIPQAKISVLVELLENRLSPEDFLEVYKKPKFRRNLDAELYSAVGMLRAAADTLIASE
jgi:hypothetical protein